MISRELRGVVISSGTCLFREWYARPIDLPGTYYLQVVQWLYKNNQLATGRFAAFGRPIDLSIVRGPIFLLAARDDEIVAPEQLLAAGASNPHGGRGLHASRAVHGSNHPPTYLAQDSALARGILMVVSQV